MTCGAAAGGAAAASAAEPGLSPENELDGPSEPAAEAAAAPPARRTPMFQTRPRNRYAPITPSSDHAASFSGGAMKSVYTRSVSAPYRAISSSGGTTLRRDFDIFVTSAVSSSSPRYG